MTDTGAAAGKAREPSKEEIIASARKDLESSRELSRRTGELNGEQPGQQRMGVTVDLCHKHITSLPDEVIDVIKNEIERLAISHNQVSSFPPKLAECKRLRYLNARFNRFPEFPKPVLQLASLEILDLAKNGLRSLPDEIRSLTSLKVLAVQRNKIERLPTCLGEMNGLRVLKVEENPLEFPPYELCVGEGDRAVNGEKEVLSVTVKIKKWLLENSGSSSRSTNADSDGEMSEGNAETPRPVRPVGRFPVRPSLGSGDSTNAAQSTSPDPPPPVPNRSHERMKSVNNSNTRKQYLLSPPTTNAVGTGFESGGDVTVRTKRHGIITPRGPDGTAQALALSPSTLQDAFSNAGSRPHSRTGSGISSASLSAESLLDVGSLVCKVVLALAKQANEMRQTIDGQNTLKQHIELELRAASNRSDILGRYLRRARNEFGKPGAARPGYLLRPTLDCLGSITHLARLLSSNSPMLCRAIDHDRYRTMFWDIQREGWELFIGNTRMSSAVKSVNHSRHTSSSSQFRLQYHSSESSRSIPMTSIFDPRTNLRNGPSPSMLDQTLGPPFGFSPFNPGPKQVYSRPVQLLGPDGTYTMREEDVRTEMSYDPIWETVYMSLRDLCEKANEGLPKIQSIFNVERQKTLRTADPDSEVVRHLASLIGRGNTLLDTAQALNKRLNEMNMNDRKIRHDLEFWQLCRNIIVDWTGYVNKLKSLTSYSSTPQAETKSTMKLIHNAVKDASARIQYSPWGHYLSQTTEEQNEIQTLRNRPMPSAGLLPNSAVGAMLPPPNPTGINLLTTNVPVAPVNAITLTGAGSNGSIGSVPSTPLSAALGPAALATLPNKDLGQIGPIGTTRPINFFERADRLAATMSKRQPEVLYGKKLA